MLKLIISGNIGQDAVIRDGGNGRSAIGFSVGTSKKVKDEYVTTWVKCTKWVASGGSLAIADYLKKGVRVLVIGEASCEVYQEKANLICNVVEIELMSKSEGGAVVRETPNYATEKPILGTPTTGDDLPF
jgi:single-stranded DNA-binding protein